MKVLVDTNVILDVLLEREEFKIESGRILSLIEHRKCKGFVSATSITDIYYISRKTFHDIEMEIATFYERLLFPRIYAVKA